MTDASIADMETDLVEEGGVVLPPPFFELSRLMVVAIDGSQDDKLVWNAQVAPNGAWGTAWTPINQTAYLILATGSTVDGRVAVIALTRDNPAVQYIDEGAQGADGQQRWNDPVDLGLPKGVSALGQLVMTRNADGRIEAFGVDGESGAVWWIYQNPPKIVERTEWIVPPGQTEPIEVHVMVPEPPDQPWSDWQMLPGTEAGGLTAGNNADGRIVLVATGRQPSENPVLVTQQKECKTLTSDDWTGWERIDTDTSGLAVGQPSIGLDADGSVNIFMIGRYDQVAQLPQTAPGAQTWGTWIRPGMTDAPLIAMTTAIDGDGHLILVAVDDAMGLHANFQNDALFQRWSSWRKIGIVPGAGQLATNYNADGKVSFFIAGDEGGSLSMLSQASLDATSWEAGFTNLGGQELGAYGVVRDLTPPGHG